MEWERVDREEEKDLERERERERERDSTRAFEALVVGKFGFSPTQPQSFSHTYLQSHNPIKKF